MVDTPLDKLLTIAYADLHKNQAEFQRIAKEVDPSKTPKEVLGELASGAPVHLEIGLDCLRIEKLLWGPGYQCVTQRH